MGGLRDLADPVAAGYALDLEGYSFHCLVLLGHPVTTGSNVSTL